MKKIVLLGSLFSLLILAGCSIEFKTQPGSVDDLVDSSCQTNQDLKKADLDNYDTIGRTYISDINSGNMATIKSIFVKDFFESTGLMEQLQSVFTSMGVVSNPNLINVLKVDNNLSGAICGDGTNPQGEFIVNTLDDYPNFVSLIYEVSSAKLGEMYLVITIINDQNTRKIVSIESQISQLGGYGKDVFINSGDSQLEKGNKRNAFFLYGIAKSLTLNRPLIQDAYIDTISQKINTLLSDKSRKFIESDNIYIQYKIHKIETVVIPSVGTVGLKVSYMTDDLKNKDKLLRESDAIEKYINNTYPEYKEVFKNLLITADKQTMVDGKKSLDSYDVKVYKLQ